MYDKSNKLALKYAEQLKKFLHIKPLSKNASNMDLVNTIGGDGTMLHSIHKFRHLNARFYGINAGSFGFLMNRVEINKFNNVDNILEILSRTEEVLISPPLLNESIIFARPIKHLNQKA